MEIWDFCRRCHRLCQNILTSPLSHKILIFLKKCFLIFFAFMKADPLLCSIPLSLYCFDTHYWTQGRLLNLDNNLTIDSVFKLPKWKYLHWCHYSLQPSKFWVRFLFIQNTKTIIKGSLLLCTPSNLDASGSNLSGLKSGGRMVSAFEKTPVRWFICQAFYFEKIRNAQKLSSRPCYLTASFLPWI